MAKFIVILGFLLSFAAGLVIGSRRALVDEAPAHSSPPKNQPAHEKDGKDRRSRSGYLTAELGLTSEQRAQLDKIWSAVAKANDQDERRRRYRRERDGAIADLVPAPRLGEYDQVINTYHDRIEALEGKARDAYRDAVEQTKDILTPEQRTRYEALLKRHRWGTGGSRDRSTTTRRSETRATSQPGGTEPITSSHELLKGAP